MGRRHLALALLLVASLALAARAELAVPPAPAARVNDYAEALTRVERGRLEDKLAALEGTSTNQVVVAVFRSLAGESLEDFSIRLAQAWRVGRPGLDNGVILLVFLDDRKMRIEVGYGLEATLADAVAGAIIRDVVAPRFREDRLAEGLEAGLDAIAAAIAGAYAQPLSPAPRGRRFDSAQRGALVAGLLVIGAIDVFVLMLLAGVVMSKLHAKPALAARGTAGVAGAALAGLLLLAGPPWIGKGATWEDYLLVAVFTEAGIFAAALLGALALAAAPHVPRRQWVLGLVALGVTLVGAVTLAPPRAEQPPREWALTVALVGLIVVPVLWLAFHGLVILVERVIAPRHARARMTALLALGGLGGVALVALLPGLWPVPPETRLPCVPAAAYVAHLGVCMRQNPVPAIMFPLAVLVFALPFGWFLWDLARGRAREWTVSAGSSSREASSAPSRSGASGGGGGRFGGGGASGSW